MKKRAFLFGINEYNEPIAKLNFARQDAKAVARALIDGYDFRENEVVLVTCDGRAKPTGKFDILDNLNWTEELDLLIVGFWGHGVWRNGKLYLCPIGTRLERLPETAPTLDELRKAISRIPAKNVCIILDCCQSKLEIGKDTAAPTFDAHARDIVLNCASVTTSDQTIAVLNACSEGQRAYEWDEKEHGYFTVHLLEALEKREANVATMFRYVQEETKKSTGNKQSPFFECRGSSEIILPAVPIKPYFVPENPNDVKIVTNHEIGEINVTIQRIDLPESAQPQALPPIPKNLRQFQSELAGIGQAIQQLQDGTHPALDPAKKAISDAKSQLDALISKRDSAWKSLNSPDLRPILVEAVRKTPEADASAFFKLRPSGVPFLAFVNVVGWEKLVIQATAANDQVEKEYRTRCTSEIEKLNIRRSQVTERIRTAAEEFRTKVFSVLFSRSPGYNEISAPFPWLEFSRCFEELMKYGLGWSEEPLWIAAEVFWKEERPCILSQPGHRLVKTIDGVEYAFRWCPAGSFQMGGPRQEWNGSSWVDKADSHTVNLTQGFWMLETQVTQRMWKSVTGTNPSNFNGDKLPVERVSWNGCRDFCKKLRSKGLEVSLPTEAQWEYACRAGSTGDYAENLDEMAWYSSNSGSKTHEVGLKKPNAWGLYDMHGNVWEWCADWYDSYDKSPASDPTGPATGSRRVNRGGSWFSDAEYCRSAYRGYDSPDSQCNYLGVRLVLAVSSSGK